MTKLKPCKPRVNVLQNGFRGGVHVGTSFETDNVQIGGNVTVT